MSILKNLFKSSDVITEPIKVKQYLYLNLEFNVYEIYAGRITETPDFKYIGVMDEMMTRLKNLEDTNKALEFHLRQKNLS